MFRRCLAVLCTSFALVLSAAAPAGASPVDNHVEADNANPRREMARSEVVVVTDGGRSVDAENIAAARSHDCTGCRTLAVAVEAVLVPGDPETVAPVNLAAAWNERCTSCATFAAAHQYVVQTNGPRSLSRAAQKQAADIGRRVRAVTRSGADFPTIDAQLDQLANELWQVVNDDIVAQGGTPSGTPTKG